MTKSEIIITIICALIASSGFWAFLSNVFQKPHIVAILGEVAEVSNRVTSLSDMVEKNNADTSRSRVLRFDDELYNGIRHSQEYFNQILDEIDSYEHYCETHPEYKNSRTVEATKHIREVYQKCRDEHRFV